MKCGIKINKSIEAFPIFYNPEKRQNREGGFYDKSPFLVLSDLAGIPPILLE